jgi:hypothetical protein
VLGLTVVLESLAERPVSSAAAGWLAPLVTAAIMTPFFWRTMHFLLTGRCPEVLLTVAARSGRVVQRRIAFR